MTSAMSRLVLCVAAAVLPLLLSLSLAQAQTLAVGAALGGNFESPTSLPNGYQYNVGTSVLQPWTWTAQQGGIGAAGGPWDPPYPGTPNDAPPSASQYAFLQTSPGDACCRGSNMSATVSGLTAGSSYNVSFYFAARSQGGIDNSSQSQLTVFMNGQQIWQSVPAIQDLNGWAPASGLFTASSTTAQLVFQVLSTSDNDHAILVDSVRVQPTASPLATAGSTGINTIIALSFGSPPLNGSYYGPGVSLQPYWYNPPISAQQPWVWTPYQGGIAITGSPFDPPAPVLPPSAGRQYAFIQVSPNNALNDQSSNMSTTLTGLTPNAPYTISFYTGTRNGYSQTSSLTVYVNGQAVYYSQPVSDTGGWNYSVTSTFTPTTSSVSLVFAMSAPAGFNSDGAIVIDAITVGPPSTVSGPPLGVNTALGGNFESPSSLANGNYQYNPSTSALQPWSWTPGLGGIAAASSPFDPPYPNTPNNAPPSPAQYAFMQTSPNNATGQRVSNMSATCVRPADQRLLQPLLLLRRALPGRRATMPRSRS